MWRSIAALLRSALSEFIPNYGYILRGTMSNLSDDEIRSLKALRNVLSHVGDRMTLQTLAALVTVAVKPGLSVNELSEEINVPQQSGSRYASILLGRYKDVLSERQRAPLVEQTVNDKEPQKRSLYLNDDGKNAVKRISKILMEENR